MNSPSNKHGLTRYIPSDIREKIRREAGFGCVICGCVLVDYEHIEPEFHHAKEHDPSKMTLLCISCHGKVTRALISKKTVWAAKENPKSLQEGFVHDILFVDTNEMQINIGKSTSTRTEVILSIYGKPMIWFEPPSSKGEPIKLCAIFYDADGKVIAYINRNQFIAHSTSQDIRSQATKLYVKSGNITCLEMDREGGQALHITKMHGNYRGATVSIADNGALSLNTGSSSCTIGEFKIDSCGTAIKIGSPYAQAKYKRIHVALTLANNKEAKAITNHKNRLTGWILGNDIYNTNYEIVGLLRNNQAFNLVDEYIGNLTSSYISYKDNCYETGEPIFTSQSNIEFRNKNPNIGYDVSFRLFDKYI